MSEDGGSRLNQNTTPLVDALKHCATRSNAAFYTPGHKRGQGIAQRHRELFGDAIFRADLPELPELDNLFAPEGVILQAQQLAAEAFGAEQTWFLANGSTCGIEAAILATCGPGDKIIVPRNAHISVISGLILSGAVPIYVSPSYSAEWDMPIGVEPQSIERALKEYPDAKAVLVVSPTYQGICSDLGAIAAHTHTHNIPLIVDEAHGPHFAFHRDLPTTALSSGADIVIQSTHKVLSAFTQAAMLHTQGERIDQSRLAQSLQLTQSTSPSYLLLGSLDAARHQMSTQGKALMTRTIDLANRASHELKQLSGLRVLQPGSMDSELRGDCTRLTVDVSPLGLTGFDADDLLHTKYGITAELPALRTLTFIISLGNTTHDIDQLIEGFTRLCAEHSQTSQHSEFQGLSPLSVKTISSSALTPRQAFFSQKRSLSHKQA
ncbi:MAG: aminotransferase class I/II-fold pyridoxal phosphate-dependent enzyme, partial [Cyanobacteria bacterium J06576_12]